MGLPGPKLTVRCLRCARSAGFRDLAPGNRSPRSASIEGSRCRFSISCRKRGTRGERRVRKVGAEYLKNGGDVFGRCNAFSLANGKDTAVVGSAQGGHVRALPAAKVETMLQLAAGFRKTPCRPERRGA